MKKKCYIYTRVSTVRQVEGFSLDAQKDRLRSYASFKNLEIVREYSDEGKSGHSIKGRPEFTRMLEDIVDEKDNISYVLVFKLSRFGRNAADVLKTMQMLSDYGIDLVSVDDAIDSSTQGGRLTLSILSAVSEIERDNIRAQFYAGVDQKMKAGGWLGGHVPFGYRAKDKELVVYESEAKVVKDIFNRYLKEGATIYSVTNYYNDNGFARVINGIEKPFTTGFIKGILRQPIYAGYFRHNYRSEKGQPLMMTKGIHEPIISEDVWKRVAEKMNQNKNDSHRGDRISILSGIVKCPVCGRGMIKCDGSKRINNNHGGFYKVNYSYKCRGHRRSNGRVCSFGRQYNQEKIDGAVFEIVSRLDTNKEFVRFLNQRMEETGSSEDYLQKIKAIRKSIYSLEGVKRNLGKEMDAISYDDLDYESKYDSIQSQVEDIYDEIEDLEGQLNELSIKKNVAEEGENNIRELKRFITNFRMIYDKMTREERREYYRLFIDSIEVYKENREDGRLIKSISFKIPIENGIEAGYDDKDEVPVMEFSIDCENTEITSCEAKATYAQLKNYILDKYGVNVSSLYIGNMKSKYGIKERTNYNVSKKKNARVPKCPYYKEEMIVEAFIHYKMLPKGTKIIREEAV